MIFAENILVCISVPLLLSMVFLPRNARRFVGAFVLGMTVCLLAAYIGGFISLISGMERVKTSVYVSPVIEEIMKFLPVLLYLFAFVPSDGQILPVSVGIGAGFATFENCCYILTSGAGNFGYILIRGMAVGVMHIVSMLAMALGLVIARRFKVLSPAAVLGALSLSMMFHGLYNLLVSAPGMPATIGYLLPLAGAAMLYIPYRHMKPGAEAAGVTGTEVPAEK